MSFSFDLYVCCEMPGVRRLLLQLRSKSWYNFEYMDFSIGKIDGMKQSIGGSCEDISGDRRGVD